MENSEKPLKNGEELVNSIINRLDYLGKMPIYHNIINTLKELTNHELNQLINLGNVVDWHNEELLNETT